MRPFTRPAEIKSQGAWQIAEIGLHALQKVLQFGKHAHGVGIKCAAEVVNINGFNGAVRFLFDRLLVVTNALNLTRLNEATVIEAPPQGVL